MQNLTTVFSSGTNQILSFGHGPGKILILVPVRSRWNLILIRSRSRTRQSFNFWLQSRLPGPGPELVPHISSQYSYSYSYSKKSVLAHFCCDQEYFLISEGDLVCEKLSCDKVENSALSQYVFSISAPSQHLLNTSAPFQYFFSISAPSQHLRRSLVHHTSTFPLGFDLFDITVFLNFTNYLGAVRRSISCQNENFPRLTIKYRLRPSVVVVCDWLFNGNCRK
jgi:hypothetical protein